MFELGIYADKAGYIYVFLLGSYSLFGFLGGVLQDIATKRTLIISGYICGFLGFSLIAHSVLLNRDFLLLIIFGLFLNGFSIIGGNMFATMWTKSELMEAWEKAGISKKEAGGYFGGLKGSMNLIGSFIGPLISPNIYMLIGFDFACLTMGAIQILFVLFFIYTTQTYDYKYSEELLKNESLEIGDLTIKEPKV